MATGPVEPLESDQTHWEEDAPAPDSVPVVEIDGDKELDAEMDAPLPRPQPLRLRHMMYLIAALAIMFWLVLLAVDARAIGALLVMGGIVFFFAGVMGATVILARAGPRGRMRFVRAGHRGGARHAVGPGDPGIRRSVSGPVLSAGS